MSETSYWSRVTQGRLSRRRALAGAATLGAGAAALSVVGCGGGGDDGGGGGGQAQPSDKPQDTTAQAKAGGDILHQYRDGKLGRRLGHPMVDEGGRRVSPLPAEKTANCATGEFEFETPRRQVMPENRNLLQNLRFDLELS